MPHVHIGDAKKSNRNKMNTIVGHTDNYQHPVDKAADMAYYENEKLDPSPCRPLRRLVPFRRIENNGAPICKA